MTAKLAALLIAASISAPPAVALNLRQSAAVLGANKSVAVPCKDAVSVARKQLKDAVTKGKLFAKLNIYSGTLEAASKAVKEDVEKTQKKLKTLGKEEAAANKVIASIAEVKTELENTRKKIEAIGLGSIPVGLQSEVTVTIQNAVDGEAKKAERVFQRRLDISSRKAAASRNPFQRVWMVCKKAAPQPLSEDEMAADMQTLSPANCTEQMSLESLCCARWENKDFNHSGFMMLASSKSSASGGMIGPASGIGGEVIKVCTQASDGMALMAQAHTEVATMPVECTTADITPEQLKGEADGLQPGEIVLRTRLNYFAKQQIPMSSVPTCSDADIASCSDGKKPTIVQSAWLEKVQPHGGLLVQVAEGNFNGALMTSGSYTMTAAAMGF